MVKTLHPIDDISACVAQAHGRRVDLSRAAAPSGANGAPASTRGDESALDPVAATVAALAEPLEFPPLARAIVPGDHVAIALDDAVPRAAQVAVGAVEALCRAGADADSISIVVSDTEAGARCRDELGGDRADAPRCVIHDPHDEKSLCLVGTSRQHEPLLVNRTIFDADVVLPIGLARLGGHGVYESLYPRFSDAAAIARHRSPKNLTTAEHAAEAEREADEAGWLIGAPLVVQVVAGGGEAVAQVLAGEPQAVAERGRQLCRQRWLFRSPQQVSLVVATLGGGQAAQTWANIGRALQSAEPLLDDGGAVAICSNLDRPPGKSLGRLAGSRDLTATQRRILRDHDEDSWPAWQLVRALQRGPVYLMSQLNDETVEDLGLAPIADIAEVIRLTGRYESCIVVEDSQHAVVTVEGQ